MTHDTHPEDIGTLDRPPRPSRVTPELTVTRLARNIRRIQAKLQMSGVMLADRCGITEGKFSMLRNGKVPNPEMGTLVALARGLSCDVSELFEPAGSWRCHLTYLALGEPVLGGERSFVVIDPRGGQVFGVRRAASPEEESEAVREGKHVSVEVPVNVHVPTLRAALSSREGTDLLERLATSHAAEDEDGVYEAADLLREFLADVPEIPHPYTTILGLEAVHGTGVIARCLADNLGENLNLEIATRSMLAALAPEDFERGKPRDQVCAKSAEAWVEARLEELGEQPSEVAFLLGFIKGVREAVPPAFA